MAKPTKRIFTRDVDAKNFRIPITDKANKDTKMPAKTPVQSIYDRNKAFWSRDAEPSDEPGASGDVTGGGSTTTTTPADPGADKGTTVEPTETFVCALSGSASDYFIKEVDGQAGVWRKAEAKPTTDSRNRAGRAKIGTMTAAARKLWGR